MDTAKAIAVILVRCTVAASAAFAGAYPTHTSVIVMMTLMVAWSGLREKGIEV